MAFVVVLCDQLLQFCRTMLVYHCPVPVQGRTGHRLVAVRALNGVLALPFPFLLLSMARHTVDGQGLVIRVLHPAAL